jgi:hypothetical protein
MNHIVARVGENDVFSFNTRALIWLIHVGDENVRQALHRLLSPVLGSSMSSWGCTDDLHSCTVHIELAVTHQVVPTPCKQGSSRGSERRNGEIVGCGDWTSPNHGFDHFKRFAVVIRQ